jgi:hypothetical protein
VSASVRGTSHARTGQECQDAHHWQDGEAGWLFAAVADGAGSAELGAVGAETAVKAAVSFLAAGQAPVPRDEAGWRALLNAALLAARNAVLEQAVVRDTVPRELAATLIVVVASPSLAAAAQIGDGAALLRSTDGRVTALTRPPSDEYINGTTFVVSDDALTSAQHGLWVGYVDQLAILTDGLQRLALSMPEGTPHAPFFAPLFRFVAEATDIEQANVLLEEFLRSPRITDRTDDDLTLLLATPRR